MKIRTSLVLLAVSTLALASRIDDTFTLRRSLVEGESLKYETVLDVSQNVEAPGLGTQDLTAKGKSTYVLKVGAVDKAKGTADIEATTTMDSLELGGAVAAMMPPAPESKPMTQKGTLSDRNKLTLAAAGQLNAVGMMTGQSQSGLGMFVEFPETAVKVGDSWDYNIAKGPTTFTEDQKLKLTLKGADTVEGVAVWVVTVSGSFQTLLDPSKIPGADAAAGPGGMSLTIEGKSEVSGEAMLAKDTGKLVSSKITVKSVSKIHVGDQITADSSGTSKFDTKLVKS